MKLFDKVYVKSQKTHGYIVDIVKDSYTVEKEGGYGPIFWNLPADDLISAERLKEIDDFKNCLKNYRLHSVSFTYKGTRYDFVGWWGLNWEEDGEDKWLDFHSKKDFRKAPIFDGKTIMEIADQVTDVSIDLDPEWPNERFYQKKIRELEENG